MSINQLNFNGMTKVDVAIKRIQSFEPKEGYYLAFSGGKDSIVTKELCNMAGVKYDAHYNVTTVDPPELLQFIKEHHSDVKWEKARYKDGTMITMWNLIPKRRLPPTRVARYCCQELKEGGGEGRFVITGVRWDESVRRRATRGGLEMGINKSRRELLDPDNPDNEEMVRICPTKGKHILNPIIDWSDSDVWEFIKTYNLPYCELYDKGFKRLGCIGCPMSTHQKEELEQYPKYKANYLKAFQRMLDLMNENELKPKWQTPEEVMAWWVKL